jgi:hypothetical protein
VTETVPFAQWCVVELMGHRRVAGYVAEVRVAGADFLRIDIYDAVGEPYTSRLYSPAAVYCIHPTVREVVIGLGTDLGYDHGPLVKWRPPTMTPAIVGEEADEDGEHPF